jgi:hypothetical protein
MLCVRRLTVLMAIGAVALVQESSPAQTRNLGSRLRPPAAVDASEPILQPQFGAATSIDTADTPVQVSQPAKDGKPKPAAKPREESGLLHPLRLTPPSAGQLFRLESEEMLRERLRMEVRERLPHARIEFPDAPAPAPTRQVTRDWPACEKWVEPNYVISKRLFFEQRNLERYAENVGLFQPVVAAGVFSFDALLWPVRRVIHPFRCYQVNTDCYSPYFSVVPR